MMLTRFKDRSRRSVEAAFEEARMLGHDSLGDEDLLLGILHPDEEGVLAATLTSEVAAALDQQSTDRSSGSLVRVNLDDGQGPLMAD
jgi:hypothetical protein